MTYAPVPELKPGGKPVAPPEDETPEVKAWRARMKTEEAKQLYKERAATAELSNAQAHNRGMEQFPVRGLKKVGAVVLLFALAHNLACGARLMAGGWTNPASSGTTLTRTGEQPLPGLPSPEDKTAQTPCSGPRLMGTAEPATALPGDSS